MLSVNQSISISYNTLSFHYTFIPTCHLPGQPGSWDLSGLSCLFLQMALLIAGIKDAITIILKWRFLFHGKGKLSSFKVCNSHFTSLWKMNIYPWAKIPRFHSVHCIFQASRHCVRARPCWWCARNQLLVIKPT